MKDGIAAPSQEWGKPSTEFATWIDAASKMSTPPETRDLAIRLIAYESDSGKSSVPRESAALRVFEKLRQSLSTFAGAAAFQSLAFRALSQAQSEVPHLWAVQIAEDGSLEGLADLRSQIDNDMNMAGEEGTILIAHLLSLLHIFLGEALTLSLLQVQWPSAVFDDHNSESGRKS